MNYIVVDDNTGGIIGEVATNVSYIPNTAPVSQETHYWSFEDSEFLERYQMPVLIEGTTIKGLPCSGELTVTGPLEYSGPYLAPDVPFHFDLPGEYTITLKPTCIQWLDTVVVMVVE
jgi:hypothetical protein